MTILDIDEDGTPELFTMDSTGLTVQWSDGGEDSHYRGSGTLGVGDADGDGYDDIIATDTVGSRVWIYRNLGNDLAPPIGLHTTRSLGSNVHFGDLSGDDVPEILLIDADGRIIHTTETEAHSASSW